jgi:CheY-like chemotaxis protein
MSASQRLLGLRVLLVEDEGLVAMLGEELLTEAGCEVVLAMQLVQALELAASENFDFAVLDVNLGGGTTSLPLARVLVSSGTPFMFASGYGPGTVLSEFPEHEVVRKPYSFRSLCDAISRAIP